MRTAAGSLLLLRLTIVPRGKELQHGLVEQMVQVARDEMVEAVQRIPAIEMIDAAGQEHKQTEARKRAA
jgi:hypothetical protein